MNTAKPAPVKRRMRREDRRDEILRSATEVFGRLGFRSATTSELARAAGVSEALLYQHFPSKQSLLVACIERLGNEIYDGLQILLSSDEDPTRTFADLARRLERIVVRRPEIHRLGFVILAELEEPEIRDATRAMVERNVDLLARAISRGQKRGSIRRDQDPDQIAWLLVGLYQLFGLLQRLDLLDRVGADALARIAHAFRTVSDREA